MPEQTCRYHEAVDEMRHAHAESLEESRRDREALRAAVAGERSERERAVAELVQRVSECESVTRPWRSVAINVGTAMVLALGAYAKAKGWI